ncbi:MAG: glycosyl transferase family 1, partial [Cyanobacteria bacterium SW_10_48_33]
MQVILAFKYLNWKKKYIRMNRNKLDVLFLIPHPFYQDRGSPIADEMVLRVLSERGNEVDVVTYSEGKDIRYDNINLYRTINLPWVKNVSPGFSWKKLIYDFLML